MPRLRGESLYRAESRSGPAIVGLRRVLFGWAAYRVRYCMKRRCEFAYGWGGLAFFRRRNMKAASRLGAAWIVVASLQFGPAPAQVFSQFGPAPAQVFSQQGPGGPNQPGWKQQWEAQQRAAQQRAAQQQQWEA